MPIVSSHIPQNTSDCCCGSSWKRRRRCQARASIPRIASGRSQTICPPSGSVKRRSGPEFPRSKSPPAPPGLPVGDCCPVPFLPVLVGPPFPFVGGVPFPEVFPRRLVVFVEVFAGGPPLNPPLPNNPPRRRSMPL